MPYFPATSATGFALRFVMIALCMLPFTGTVAAAAAFGLSAPVGPLPSAPTNEEDERDENTEERVADPRTERLTDPKVGTTSLLPIERAACRPANPDRSFLSRPTAADPFRNGLGSPYRC